MIKILKLSYIDGQQKYFLCKVGNSEEILSYDEIVASKDYDKTKLAYHSTHLPYVEDHLGNKFASNKLKAKHYGIEYKTYMYRINHGWSEEDALTSEVISRDDAYDDFMMSLTFEEREQLDKLNISRSCLLHRLETGWTKDKILQCKSQNHTWTDHKGNVYPNFTSMCEAYNLTIYVVKRRLKKGWDIEKALTTPAKKQKQPVVFRGVSYPSKVQVYNKFNLSSASVKKQQRLGLSFEDAVEAALKSQRHFKVKAFGQEWANCTELAKHFGIPRRKLSNAINLKHIDPEVAVNSILKSL